MTPILSVRDLRVAFPGPAGPVHPVDGVSFDVAKGETLALVGESGCGKSLTALALLRLVPPPGRVAEGSRVSLDGSDLLALDAEALRRVRGRRIGMVFQDPLTSLNPVLRIGEQIAEGIVAHGLASRHEARARALALLREVGIADAEARLDAYPHQLSGGMRQRVGIAIALACEPDVLIADEPTTALDVTIQAQILEILDRLRRERGMALLLITHDFGIVAGRADRVAVMYAGQVVETGTTSAVFAHPSHPYTDGLLASVPRMTGPLRRIEPIAGTVPRPEHWPAGCRFAPRCRRAFTPCATEPPPVHEVEPAHAMRCWLGAPEAR
ncbi:MAG TPA: ABC transporter ATP-binding protein [Gemmatimonadales bacterium]|nr:ABC transporter ATP-binding protein [Gemmatimonadales bacterium]